jgi:AraC-like DNA-binding protein
MDETTERLRLAYAGWPDLPVPEVPRHHHPAPILIQYTYGRGRIVFDDAEHRFAPGTVACVPAGVDYSEQSQRGFISLYIAIHGLRLDRPEILELGDDPRYDLCARLIIEESRRGGPASERAIAETLPLLVRCLRLRRGLAGRDPLVGALLELIAAHASDPAFTIAAAARRLSTSVRRLRARFAPAMGTSPQQFLAARRIDSARRLLDHGGFAVKEVAERSGFADPYYFSRAFRRSVGISPRAYRASRRR